MNISRITLRQFRSYEEDTFLFDPKLTLVTGKNGIGKTNLLEAVYMLLSGGSFRVADKDLLMHERNWMRIDGVIDGSSRQVRYQLAHRPPKQLLEHGTTTRFMHRHRLPVVLFDPDDLLLVHGSPSRRRSSLDLMLSALSAEYKTTLGKYERALLQRNNVLKKQPTNMTDVLFPWNIQLSEYGTKLTMERSRLVDQLNPLVQEFYGRISGQSDKLVLSYKSSHSPSASPSKYVDKLHAAFPLDSIRTTTSYGPHRDDTLFYIRSRDAKQEASRGEVRTLLLALKLAYATLLEAQYDTKPILLFDDVFSELDADRRGNLFSHLGEYQTIVTDTHQIPGALNVIKIS